MVKVDLTSAARDDLKSLDGSVQAQIVKKLQLLQTDTEAGKPLLGDLAVFRTLPVGNRQWRIIYRIVGEDAVLVWCIGTRADNKVYKEAIRRVRALPRGEVRDQLLLMAIELGLVERDEPDPPPPRRRRGFRRHRG